MSSFRGKTLNIRRRAMGAYNISGFFEITDPRTVFTITASVQPLTGDETLLLPENLRERDSKKIYTSTELFGVKKGSNKEPDIVLIGSVEYNVVKVFVWQNNVVNHYKVILAKRTTNDTVIG